jgi:hypothetical protein
MSRACEAQTRKAKAAQGEAKGKIVPIRFTKAEAEQLAQAAKIISTGQRHFLEF